MTIPQRIKVKYFVQDPTALDLPAFIPVFHHWIQEQRVEGLLLDVADYKHMQNGPGIVLIGHDADYGLDLAGGRPGLIYDRKRQWETAATLAERLRTVFRNALHGCQAVEQDSGLNGRVQFRAEEAELTFLDRLRAPNEDAVYASVEAEVKGVLDTIYGVGNYTLTRASTDRREPLTLHIRANSVDLGTLLQRAA